MAMAIGSNTGNAMARKGIIYPPSFRGAHPGRQRPAWMCEPGMTVFGLGLSSRNTEVAAIQRQQPFPVPFGGIPVVDRALGESKTVMGAGIDLDLGIGAIGLHGLLHLVDGFHRRVDVSLRAAEIEFGLGLCPGQMRT